MPVMPNSIKVDLGSGRTLYVIRQDATCEIIMSLVEDHGKVAKRTRILLTLGEAIQVSRALASLSMLQNVDDKDPVPGNPEDDV